MQKVIILCVAVACVASPAGTLAAQETDTPTLLAYLGLSAADGKTTVGDNAAAVEAHMLASAMAIKAASKIKERVKTAAGTSRVVLLVGDEKFSLAPYYQTLNAIASLNSDAQIFIDKARAAGCGDVGGPALTQPTQRDFDFTASDIIGAFRTSTTLSAAPVTVGLELLKSAMAVPTTSQTGITWVSPADVMQPSGGQALRDDLGRARARIRPYSSGACDKVDKEISKAADALLAASNALTASKDAAPSLLEQASQLAGLIEDNRPIRVLKVDMAKAGGTLVNTSNIWTSIGFPGLTMRGGLVATYRLIDPVSGQTEAAGIVACRYPKRLLQTINARALETGKVACDEVPPGG